VSGAGEGMGVRGNDIVYGVDTHRLRVYWAVAVRSPIPADEGCPSMKHSEGGEVFATLVPAS